MDTTLLIAWLLFALVFVVAGIAKLINRAKGSRQAMRDFGVPAALAAPLELLLPLAKLAVAAALVPVATAWWGAVGALTLLLLDSSLDSPASGRRGVRLISPARSSSCLEPLR